MKTMIINLSEEFKNIIRVELATRNQQQPKLELPARKLVTPSEMYKIKPKERFLK